jgi:DNA-binding SARP family transcriptional activator/tetratricopeptide (TPR) repeat protein
MRFGVLGPLLVDPQTSAVRPVPGIRQRVLLAALLVEANQVVAAEKLAEIVWEGAPPTAAAALRTQVMRLRRALGDEAGARVITRAPGYVITLAPEELDSALFEARCQEAGAAVRAGRWHDTVTAVGQALALWRGAPLLDVDSQALREEHAARWEELRVQAQEWRIDAELSLGRHQQITQQLADLARRYPLREHLHAQRMLALYRCGRQAEALEAYQDARTMLAQELGVEPGAPLRELQQAILAGRAYLAAPPADRDDSPRRLGAAVVPRQLPADITHFTGRADALRTLHELAARAVGRPGAVAISAIDGTAGIGKSALAVHWGQQAAGFFPDGQLYVNLRGFDPTGLPVEAAVAIRGFLAALGVPAARLPGDADAQASLYRSLLAGRQVLVVLDNACDAEQVRPLLPGSAGCLAVITSRNYLGSLVAVDGAEPLTLDLLSPAEARELLARRLGGKRVSAEPEAAERLVAACAGLPLALNIIAARAAASPGLSLAVLAEQVGDSRGRLAALDIGDVKASVRAVISWSYRALGEAQARMFRLLAVHPGPDITAAAAASLTAVSPAQAGAALRDLSTANLLAERVPGRYALHDLLRAYAASLAADGDDPESGEALGRTVDYYLNSLFAALPLIRPGWHAVPSDAPRDGVRPERFASHQRALDWCRAEQTVLLSVIARARDAGLDQQTAHLAATLSEFFGFTKDWPEWEWTGNAALVAATRAGDLLGQANAHSQLGKLHATRGRYPQAHPHLDQALTIMERLGQQPRVSNLELHIAITFGFEERFAEAITHGRRAAALCPPEDHVRQSGILNALGWFHACLDQHEQALALCQQALDRARRAGDTSTEASALDSLGYIHQRCGRYDESDAQLSQAARLREARGERFDLAGTLTRLGDTSLAAGRAAAARQAWERAAKILDDLEHPNAEQVRERLRALG